MKTNIDNKNVAGYLMLAIIMIIAGLLLYRMTYILEVQSYRTANNFISATSVSSTNQVEVLACAVEQSNKERIENSAIIEAYDSLSNELSSWMAIMGIFATVFGLLIPIGSYLLQKQSLRDERESIMKEVVKSRDDVFVKIQESVDKMPVNIAEKMKPMWNFLAANFDRFLVNDGEVLRKNSILNWYLVANFVIEFDICLDCLVRAKNSGRMLEVVIKYQELLISIQKLYPKVWKDAVERLKDKMQPSNEFVTGREYAAVIGSDSNVYAWLKEFYGQFAPWKFV
jgi:hypothetical protein